MLRLTFCFLITSFLFVVNSVFAADVRRASLTRLTNTPEHAVNLNPTLSDDGKIVVFESSADLAGTGVSSSFHALRADLDAVPVFTEIGAHARVSVLRCRATEGSWCLRRPRISLDRNADRNSEIFLFDGSELKQLTETEPG